jgi:glycosyltransferase involved in cell wall biosynthesis
VIHSLRAFRHRSYRLFFVGQSVAVLGNWIQFLAMNWLVYRLTGSAWLAQMTDDYTHWVYASSRTVLVPSRSTRMALIDRGYSADRLRLWPRGVDTVQFSPARSSVEMRRRWGIDDRRLAILYAGRLSVEKGLRLIVPIRRELFRRGIEHRFIFVGDGPLMNEMRERCPDSYFLGTVPQGQVAIAMATADLFLYPGENDAFGHVVLEAQASGLPVVVSDRGGPAEQVIPDGTGAVCPAGDVTAFVDQIVRLRHPIGRRSMSVAARQYALSRDWPDALRPLFRTWREAITAHVSRARGFKLVGHPHDRALSDVAAQSR